MILLVSARPIRDRAGLLAHFRTPGRSHRANLGEGGFYFFDDSGWADTAGMTTLSVAHERLDGIGRHRHAASDQFAAIGGDERIVFNPDAQVPKRLGHIVGWANI